MANKPIKHIRMDEATLAELVDLQKISGFPESELLRILLRAGVAAVKSGQYNPFQTPRLQEAATTEEVSLTTPEAEVTYKAPRKGKKKQS